MDQYVVLKKKDLNAFIEKMAAAQKVMAPVKKGVKNFAFEEVNKGEDVSLQYIPTILPPKKYFMPQRETIQSFDSEAHSWASVVEGEAMVLFGVHTCDLSGIDFLNTVMNKDPKDANYIARQEKITLIGFECNHYCDEYASCHVMGNHLPNNNYDLFMTELKDVFLIHVASAKGDALIKQTGLCQPAEDAHKQELKELREAKEKEFKDEVDVSNKELKNVFEKTFESKVWEDLEKRCIACTNCTNVCPTCYCFDIKDDVELSLTKGVRIRRWDGCQNEEFAKVAGGEDFREGRGARQRHRYNRKFSYPVPRFNRYTCTGCGRCSRTCMARINLKETINALAKEAK